VLLFFNPATHSFQPVQATVLVNDTLDHVLIVRFDSTSLPTLASLHHTVFTIGVTLPGSSNQASSPVPLGPTLASTDSILTGPATATFVSSSQLTLTLTPLQQGQFAFSQSALAAAAGGDGSGDSADVPFHWVWEMLGLDKLWQTLSIPLDRSVPAQQSSPTSGTEDDSNLDEPNPGPGDASLPPQDSNEALPIPRRGVVVLPLASPAERRAALGLFFAGTALLHERKRRQKGIGSLDLFFSSSLAFA
jgi:hypothetical protein